MIAAHARGLATIAQVSFVRYEQEIRAVLGLADGEAVACGMSMGVPDLTSDLNRMSMPREPIANFAIWHGTNRSEIRSDRAPQTQDRRSDH